MRREWKSKNERVNFYSRKMLFLGSVNHFKINKFGN